MGETSTDLRAIEAAVLKALSTPFPNLTTARNPGAEFYAKFQRAAEDYDRPIFKKYDQDLDSTLIFASAGLFSAVTTAFIIDVQRKLEPDYQEMSYALLMIIANTSLGNTPTGTDSTFPRWNGPDPTASHAQSILYSSLSTSLFAAFVAMLGKQWLNRYASVDRGSAVDRGRERKRKMDGMITWKFDLVMEFLPLLLQAALLLLGCALSQYLFFINKTVSSVLIGFTAVGLLLYSLITFAATFSFNCPFQTPPSLILRFLIRTKYSKRCRRWTRHILSQMKKWWTKLMRNSPNTLPRLDTVGGNNVISHTELPMAAMNQPLPLFDQDTDWGAYVLDSDCIAFMFGMPAEMDVTAAILGFIPEIVWHAGIQEIPLNALYQTFLECFDRSSGHLVLKWAFRDMAYLSGKALLHVAIQRRCIDDMPEFIAGRRQVVELKHIEGDPDMESTLHMISHVIGGFELVRQQNQRIFSFTISHHAWMVHVLLYRAWDALEKGTPPPRDVTEFIRHSLRLEPPPPARISADYLFMLCLVLGIRMHWNDLSMIDKSHQVGPQSTRVHEVLTEKFQSPTSTTDDIDCALLALRVIDLFEGSIAPSSLYDNAQKSFNLFHVIMQGSDTLSPVFSYEKQWEASRLTMHAAYGSGKFRPPVKDPQAVLDFLDHHFDSVTPREENQDEPIQNALRALAHTCHPATIAALGGFDPTEGRFVRGICQVFQDDKPPQLRKAALLFLPLISDQWFDAHPPILDFDGRTTFCINWASVVDGIMPKPDDGIKPAPDDGIQPTPDELRAILAVLLGMINSPHWRPHIVKEKWKLLEYFPSVPDDSQPLKRCIDNPELIDAVKDVVNPQASFLWLEILWSKYGELKLQVREQLKTATKGVIQDGRKADLDVYLSAMRLQLKQAQDALTEDDPSPADATAALRKKIGNLEQAMASLAALEGD